MRIESKLCHLSENKAVVLVNGWLNDKNVGSALAEAVTVDLAEDKAISRLKKRINDNNNNIDNESNIDKSNKNQIDNKAQVDLHKKEKYESINVIQEPFDWSNELTSIDSEISRLNWSRDDEMSFLEKNLGYKSRNEITNYNELVKYLSILKDVQNSISTPLNTKKMKDFIDESDLILKDLSWNYKQGREFLLKEFNVSTRKELNEEQLLSFIHKLRSIRDQYLSK